MKFTFIKLPQHRKFSPEPIYYDAAKEERLERERNIRIELGLKPLGEEEAGNFKDRVKGKMGRRMKSHFEVTRSARKKSNIRLIIILIALMALFYYLLHAGYDWYSQFL
jgi:hypothetical protein